MGAEVARSEVFQSSTGLIKDRGSPVSMHYPQRQFALPIHLDNSSKSLLGVPQVRDEQTSRPENTLRRKTPNGTLNAGYYGTAETPHPQKHQLMFSVDQNYAPAESGSRTFLEHQQRHDSSHGLWNDRPGCGWYGSQFPQAYSLPVMDSMLHQMPSQRLGTGQYLGQTVPSVLQPSCQYLGPTASGGQGAGPYGPYWHDGTFVPYRPTALRDPRYYHHPSAHWPAPLPSPQLTHQAGPWQQPSMSHGSPWQSSYDNDRIGNVPTHRVVRPQHVYPYHTVSAPPRPQDHELAQASTARTRTILPPADASTEYGPCSPSARERDETFAWALQQYRELLGHIQQTRREHQQNRPTDHYTQRPAFYPKPPKVSASGSFHRVEKRKADSSNLTASEPPRPPLLRTETASTGGLECKRDDGPTTSSSALGHPTIAMPPHNPGYPFRNPHGPWQNRPPLPQQQQWPHPLHQPSDGFRTLRRSSGSSVSPVVSQPAGVEPPPFRAAVALTYMTKLCDTTDWQWTDGMHLGGCLAYALGHYEKALKWYRKVLDRDPQHLEAISNYAATLLAVGRRSEAEQHWVKVLKVAPNHFEAVEHLVGLLCHEQRSSDAIRVIEYVERSLRQSRTGDLLKVSDRRSDCASSSASRSPCQSELSDKVSYDFDADVDGFQMDWRDNPAASEPGFGSSGYAIPGCDNGRMLALVHAKGNMLYGLGDNGGAARAFEDAVLIAAGRWSNGIQGFVQHILTVVSSGILPRPPHQGPSVLLSAEPLLLTPDQALATARLCFPHSGELPGLKHVPGGHQSIARKAVLSTTSNSLLSLAKIFQDGLSGTGRSTGVTPLACGVRDILALYYLSLSLQPSPSTANNVGILLANIQQATAPAQSHQAIEIPGVISGSGVALALQYYNYGLQLDQHHAHLYTNLGSLLKDIGHLDAAINMYDRAVKCDGRFDIALANLANAVKDKGRTSDAIVFYKRAVAVSPDFAEAVCGLANALNSVCSWQSRGGIAEDGGKRDRWHVDQSGMLLDARLPGAVSSGWIKRVVDIVERQLVEGETWGAGTLTSSLTGQLIQQIDTIGVSPTDNVLAKESTLRNMLNRWAGQRWEGARVTRLVERATKRIGWQWYQDLYVKRRERTPPSYNRPQLPASLAMPTAPTVLPFHTFTCPMSAKQIRLISQRNGLRISVSALRSSWLPKQVYLPPKPPQPYLKVGYVSSDFNNHPLAHLMQSVFGMHDTKRVKAYCYATTASDNTVHRLQIEAESPVFYDASAWPAEALVNRIVQDGIHILVNLNGYTRGARNEVFAARPAPIQMSFMGFAGTLGAEWCDYLLADETSIPVSTLRPSRRNVTTHDQVVDDNYGGSDDDWVYGENIIFCRDTFFCCDHKQSAPDAKEKRSAWDEERGERWLMRKELFPQISDDTIIFGNFNQLYKVEPTTFRTWLRILARVPNSILWLLRFPDLGESNLLATARLWAGTDVASRVIFTDVAPKHLHISRARVCDVVLDTAECNAHTTAADVLWSGTPLLTLPRYSYKMCSRMAASILKGALPKTAEGALAEAELIAESEEDYEEKAVRLGKSMTYPLGCDGVGSGRLMELRKMLYHARWTSALFDTKRWVSDLEDGFEEAWTRYVDGKGGDIWLDELPRKG